MRTVADIFSAFGGPSAAAKALGVKVSTASEMKRRGSIPAEYWQDMIAAARQKGIVGIDAEVLTRLHSRGRSRSAEISGGEERSQPARDGHFSRFYSVRQPHFATRREIAEHVGALRDEWERG